MKQVLLVAGLVLLTQVAVAASAASASHDRQSPRYALVGTLERVACPKFFETEYNKTSSAAFGELSEFARTMHLTPYETQLLLRDCNAYTQGQYDARGLARWERPQ